MGPTVRVMSHFDKRDNTTDIEILVTTYEMPSCMHMPTKQEYSYTQVVHALGGECGLHSPFFAALIPLFLLFLLPPFRSARPAFLLFLWPWRIFASTFVRNCLRSQLWESKQATSSGLNVCSYTRKNTGVRTK